MSRYCVVSARPKDSTNHANSEFKLYQHNTSTGKWDELGWKNINFVSDLLRAGHSVVTGNITDNTLSLGAAVELELRITKNDTKYKISQMPDK